METTLNIHKNVLEKISAAAILKGISCSAIIGMLLQKVMNENTQSVLMGKLIRYQKRCRPDSWHTFHVTYRDDEYEYYLDMKKFRKMSVSYILAYAVNKYLREIIKGDDTDNYRHHFKNYTVVQEYFDTIPSWKLIWGYPLHIEQHIRQYKKQYSMILMFYK